MGTTNHFDSFNLNRELKMATRKKEKKTTHGVVGSVTGVYFNPPPPLTLHLVYLCLVVVGAETGRLITDTAPYCTIQRYLVVVGAETGARDGLARGLCWAAVGFSGGRRVANERALRWLLRASGFEHAFWLGGSASRNVLGALLEDLTLWRAERASNTCDLHSGFTRLAWSGVWVFVVRGWAWW